MRKNVDENYWTGRYESGDIPWDMRKASPPLTAYLQQLNNRDRRILIPGAGNAYEAEWLWKNGFSNTWVADISDKPLVNLKKRCPDFPDSQLLHENFFDLHGTFDLILEQTFFCALQPQMRDEYAEKAHTLLVPNGRLVGVLFQFPLTSEGPPFGGDRSEYQRLFSRWFRILKLSTCYNSIEPRRGNELFMELLKL